MTTDQTATPYRPDIDGLRAVAIMAVVLYHALPEGVIAGFVGVDIFFVISGYLIGGIVLAAALDRRFSFAAFYAARARRILPMLVVVVTATLVAGLVLCSATELTRSAGQALGALLGFSNLYFWKHQEYFTADARLQPLLMTWSLGVEEQFYLFFPALILLVARLDRRRRAAALAIVTALSFGVAAWLAGQSPVSCFYLLPPRAWEMGAGGVLAMLHQGAPHPAGSRRPWTTELAATAGLALLLGAAIAFDRHTGFILVTAVPVLGTLILLQTQESWINRALLSARPVVFVGLVSYSWYLWHAPLIAFAAQTGGDPGPVAMLVVVALSFGIAVLSWRFIERPFRRSTRAPATLLPRYGLVVAAALALPLAIKLGHGWPGRMPSSVRLAEAVQADGRGTCLVSFGASRLPHDPTCAPPGATIALLGDSHGAALAPGLAEAARARHSGLLHLSKAGCLPLLGVAAIDSSRPLQATQCDRFIHEAVTRLAGDPAVRIVVIAGNWPADVAVRFIRVPGASNDSIAMEDALVGGLRDLILRLRAAGKTVVLVGDVPHFDADPVLYLISDAIPARRALAGLVDGGTRDPGPFIPEARLNPHYDASRHLVAALAASIPGVRYVDLRAQLCPAARCRYAIGETPLFIDSHHMSWRGATLIDWGRALD